MDLSAPPCSEWVDRVRGAGPAVEVRHDRLSVTASASELTRVITATERAMRGASQVEPGGAAERQLAEARALYEKDLRRFAHGRV